MAKKQKRIPKDNYIYGFWINQKAITDWLLLKNAPLITPIELYLLCYIICVWNDPNGLTTMIKNDVKYVYLNDKIFIDNLPYLNVEKRQLNNLIKNLYNIGLIDRINPKKDERYITVNLKLIELYFKR